MPDNGIGFARAAPPSIPQLEAAATILSNRFAVNAPNTLNRITKPEENLEIMDFIGSRRTQFEPTKNTRDSHVIYAKEDQIEIGENFGRRCRSFGATNQ